MIGGALTQAFNWRATFWFIAAFQAVFLFAFLFTKDTFRRERSLTYQTALRRRLKSHPQAFRPSVSQADIGEVPADQEREQMGQRGSPVGVTPDQSVSNMTRPDLEASETPQSHGDATEAVTGTEGIHLSFRDINPIGPIIAILSKRNNLVILCSSG